MGEISRRVVAFPCQVNALPGFFRASYALVVKRLFGLLKRRSVVRVDGVGHMQLEPWDLIDSRIYFFDVWEPALSHFMKKAIRKGDVVADIGANIGYFTLLMSQAVGPEGHVFAVEPCDDIRARLNNALARNDVRNVTVIPYGISDRTERRAFTKTTANLGASRFGEPSNDGLELRRLSDVVPPDMLSRLSFIKIDVEGMEAQVMRDISSILATLPDDLTLCAELRVDDEMRDILKPFQDIGMTLLHLPNRYTMFDYPHHPLDPEPFDDRVDGQYDLALTRRPSA